MKKIFLIAFTFLVSQSYAQQINFGIDGVKPMGTSSVKNLDKCQYAYLYRHEIHDPVLESDNTEYEFLQIGKNWSKYGGYNDYRSDSIRYVDPNITVSQYFELTKKNKNLSLFYFKNIANNSIIVRDRIFTNNYVYEEPFPQFGWQLSNETTNILGHSCHKATTNFRGREWTVWYAEDIPLSNGPWKFCGLPGLILKAEDSKGEHKFEVVAIRKANEDFGYLDRNYIKTTREKFNKAKLDYKNEAWKMFSGELAQFDAEGKSMEIPHRKMFYNPEELE